jgi:histidinol phosphatase-like PHP family hydrolase
MPWLARWSRPAHGPRAFEDQYRSVLRALAAGGKALEVNTRVPLHPQIVRWRHQEGGQTVTFASDAHDPSALAHGFAEATAWKPVGFDPDDTCTTSGGDARTTHAHTEQRLDNELNAGSTRLVGRETNRV